MSPTPEQWRILWSVALELVSRTTTAYRQSPYWVIGDKCIDDQVIECRKQGWLLYATVERGLELTKKGWRCL